MKGWARSQIQIKACHINDSLIISLIACYSFSMYRFDKGDAVKVSYLHHLDQLKRGASVGEISRKFSTNENTLTVGCSYSFDPHTMVKAKLNNHGHLGALVQHELKPKSILTISGSFDTLAMEKTPRFGLALSLMPWNSLLLVYWFQEHTATIDLYYLLPILKINSFL